MILIVTFVELLTAIYKTLDEVHTSRIVQVDVAARASQLINSICSTSFLVSVHVISLHTSAILLPLSKMLQEKNVDIFKVNELMDGVFSLLQEENLIQKIVSIFHSKGALFFAINLRFLSRYRAERTGKITESVSQLLILKKFLGGLLYICSLYGSVNL